MIISLLERRSALNLAAGAVIESAAGTFAAFWLLGFVVPAPTAALSWRLSCASSS